MKKSIIAGLLVFGLLVSALLPACAATAKKRSFEIEYETTDKFITISKLTYPQEKKTKYPLVVLLHSLGYSSSYWGTLPQKFNQAGFAVLEVDLKGHGKSANDVYFKKRSWIYLSENAFKLYPQEVLKIIDKVKTEHKDISPAYISYVGADVGANTAILAAQMQTPKPVCLVLISPSISFKGLYTPIKLANAGKIPIFAVAASKDYSSVKQVNNLSKYAQGDYVQKIYPNGGTGMLMLKLNSSMDVDIVNWVVEKNNSKK